MSQSLQQKLNSGHYFSADTIAALSTGLGGPIAIVRISGTEAFSAAQSLLKQETPFEEFQKLMRAQLFDLTASPPCALDDILVVGFQAPHTFTGEDLVELHVHGNATIVYKVLQSLQKRGVRQALPGEFSFRAFRNGKLSLSQVQAMADLVSAPNAPAITLALEKLAGSQHQLMLKIKEDLQTLIGLAEVGIDFSDQDIEELQLAELKRRLDLCYEQLSVLRKSFQRGQLVQEGMKVCLAGLPNAGKSSLFNALLGRDRSIVSEIPGTTRDVVHESLVLENASGSFSFRFEDTAGLRETGDTIEKMGVHLTEKALQQSDLVLWICDAEVPFSEQIAAWKSYEAFCFKTCFVIAKIDRLSVSERENRLREYSDSFQGLMTSAKTGEGVENLVNHLLAIAGDRTARQQGEVLLTRADHWAAVVASLEHLDQARPVKEIELFAAHLRYALKALEPVLGESLPEDILGEIFSKFCIGK